MSHGVVASRGPKVYAFRMDHGRPISSSFGGSVSPICKGRVCHADDIVPTFGSGDMIQGVEQMGDDARFARQVIDRFSVFAKTGNPNPVKGAPGLANQNEDLLKVQWPAYNTSNPVFHFDLAKSSVISSSDTDRCNWIAQNVQFDYQEHGPGGKFFPSSLSLPNPRRPRRQPRLAPVQAPDLEPELDKSTATISTTTTVTLSTTTTTAATTTTITTKTSTTTTSTPTQRRRLQRLRKQPLLQLLRRPPMQPLVLQLLWMQARLLVRPLRHPLLV